MDAQRRRILLVDDSARSLSRTLEPYLGGHEVELATDVFDVVYAIETALEPYDMLFCDLGRTDLPASRLWAYLADGRTLAADRMVFVVSGPLTEEAKQFLGGVPNIVLDLTTDAAATAHLVRPWRSYLRPQHDGDLREAPQRLLTRPSEILGPPA